MNSSNADFSPKSQNFEASRGTLSIRKQSHHLRYSRFSHGTNCRTSAKQENHLSVNINRVSALLGLEDSTTVHPVLFSKAHNWTGLLHMMRFKDYVAQSTYGLLPPLSLHASPCKSRPREIPYFLSYISLGANLCLNTLLNFRKIYIAGNLYVSPENGSTP